MSTGYIHGFSRREQARLIEQSQVLAPKVFAGLDLSEVVDLLEIGCGVGAELRILGQRWPALRLTGLDRSRTHLSAAAEVLAGLPSARLVEGDAFALPFADGSFDRVITVWMLEHVRNPQRILGEALRVTRTAGQVVCTEVDNSTFAFDPPNPVIEGWWKRFNSYQQAGGGDPFVGARLARIATSVGCTRFQAMRLPIIDSRVDADRRPLLLDYLRDLLLSGADSLIAGGYVTRDEAALLSAEFERLKTDPEAEFRYSAVRLSCSPPTVES